MKRKTERLTKKLFLYGSLFAMLFQVVACSRNTTPDYPESFSGPKYHFGKVAIPPAPDYSIPQNWMFLPGDSTRFDVDLLWFYPTTFVSDSLWNMPMTDEQAKQGAVNDFESMAGIFDGSCNIYAPYYRQACLAILAADQRDREAALALANEDATRALEYYFAHYNHGRKFVIAGHSQGSEHVLELLKHNETLKKNLGRMVVAYVVGWSVTRDDTLQYPQLNLCDSAREVGCIITYNTIEDGYQEESSKLTLFPNSISVNPLLWNTSGEYAPRELHDGALFPGKNGFDTIYHYTSAQNKKGGVCVDRPVNVGDLVVYEPWFHPGIYHVYDYEFFHLNLKHNLQQRISAFDKQ